MRLSDEEIKDVLMPRDELVKSHIEANARVRELEAEAQDWHERYVICCEDSRLEKEALIRQCDRADRLAVIADALESELAESYSALEMFDAWKCCQYSQAQADVAKAKLRELVEAAEWRDECVAAVANCLYRRESCWKMVSVSIDPSGYRKRWEKAVDHAKMLAEAAEAAYQGALKAAKEG